MHEGNGAIFLRFIEEVINGGNLAAVDELVSFRYVDHDPVLGMAPDREGLKKTVAALRAAFPDLHSNVEELLEVGDKVVYRGTLRGTSLGELMGMEPTGMPFKVTEIHIDRIVGGRIVEHWGLVDEMGVMEQLGGSPP